LAGIELTTDAGGLASSSVCDWCMSRLWLPTAQLIIARVLVDGRRCKRFIASYREVLVWTFNSVRFRLILLCAL